MSILPIALGTPSEPGKAEKVDKVDIPHDPQLGGDEEGPPVWMAKHGRARRVNRTGNGVWRRTAARWAIEPVAGSKENGRLHAGAVTTYVGV